MVNENFWKELYKEKTFSREKGILRELEVESLW